MIVTVNPQKQLPASAPSAADDPIHDISPNVSLPVSNGDASDRSNGNAIDTQPMAQPPANIIKFAAISDVSMLFFFFWLFSWNVQAHMKEMYENSPAIDAKYCGFAQTDAVFFIFYHFSTEFIV